MAEEERNYDPHAGAARRGFIPYGYALHMPGNGTAVTVWRFGLIHAGWNRVTWKQRHNSGRTR